MDKVQKKIYEETVLKVSICNIFYLIIFFIIYIYFFV